MLTTRQGATIVDIEQLIAQRVADAMATLEANWNNGNGIPHEEVSEELWFEKMESMFHISNCATNCQVKLAAYAMLDSALTCWNTHTKTVLALLCLGMVLDEEKKIERCAYTAKYAPIPRLSQLGLFSPPHLGLSYSSLEEFQQPKFECYGPKPNDKLEKKNVFPTLAKIEFVRPKQKEKPVKYDEMYRLNAAVVNAVRANQVNDVKDSAWNMSCLSDFKEFDGGYVTFGRGAKGGEITGKGTLKTGKLDFEDVYFVKELQFNLFSVSQMCDKKNNDLFTDTGCFVLSPDFKLADKSQVLLKVPRKNNMYSVDMKNIVLLGIIFELIRQNI
ncbi:hypothetical protein Tco_0935833 [Tanacetum coccineum]